MQITRENTFLSHIISQLHVRDQLGHGHGHSDKSAALELAICNVESSHMENWEFISCNLIFPLYPAGKMFQIFSGVNDHVSLIMILEVQYFNAS